MDDHDQNTHQTGSSEPGFTREAFSSPTPRPLSVCTNQSIRSHASQPNRPLSRYCAHPTLFETQYTRSSSSLSSDGYETPARPLFECSPIESNLLHQRAPLCRIEDALKEIARSIFESSAPQSQAEVHNIDFRPLWEVSNDPPINIESLSWLNLDRLPSYARLYHLLNFESEAVLHPQYKPAANLYWSALEVEFELYKQHRDCKLGRSWLSWFRTEPQRLPPLRLRGLLETIRDVLKTLIPADYASCVDNYMEIKMLDQQIAHGCCNFDSIAEWIGCMLKLSCAEQRDSSVDKFTEKVRIGMMHNDSGLLVSALELLFDIFEAMKLDVLNAHIRLRRPLLIADSVSCEQRYFHSRIIGGWNISSAAAWYQKTMSESEDPLQSLAKFVTEAITTPDVYIPEAFDHDHDHIKAAQSSFVMTCEEDFGLEECKQFLEAENYRGAKRKCTNQQRPASVHALDQRNACDSFQRSWSNNVQFLQAKTLPEALDQTRTNYMKPACEERTVEHKLALASQLQDLVGAEVNRIRSMSGLDIFNLYVLGSPDASQSDVIPMRSGLHDIVPISDLESLRIVARKVSQQYSSATKDRLRALARRIAHIAVVQFRVWDPIFSNLEAGSFW